MKRSSQNGRNKKLDYDQLAKVVSSNEKYLFLSDLIPQRVVYSEVARKEEKKEEKESMDVDETEEVKEGTEN